MLPSLPKEICDAALALATDTHPMLSAEAKFFLAGIEHAGQPVRGFRLSLDSHLPMFVPDDVRRTLASADDVTDATKAIETAIRHNMTAEIEAGLSHRYANVVALALQAISSSMSVPLPKRLLDLASHRGSPVRRSLVGTLRSKLHPDHLPSLLSLAKDEWSTRSAYYGEEDDYPIAQAAVAAIGEMGPLEDASATELYRVAIDTRDRDVRYAIFLLLVRAADASFQDRLFELAINPGQRFVRIASATALIVGHDQVNSEVVNRITPKLLANRIEAVASRLLMLLALRGELADVVEAAQSLSTDDKRRVLLLLAIWMLRDRDVSTANRVARMLPVNHPGVKWALAGGEGKIGDTALDDLGGPISVEKVFQFLRPKNKKR